MNQYRQIQRLLFVSSVFVISSVLYAVESEYTFYPPYTDPYNSIGDQYYHNEYTMAERGLNYDVCYCSGDTDTGLIEHRVACHSFSLILESYVCKRTTDELRRLFTVPYDGQYEITYNGSISGDYYEFTCDLLLGAGKGKSRFWLEGGVSGEVLNQHPLYETDLSLKAFIEEAGMAAIWKLLGAVEDVDDYTKLALKTAEYFNLLKDFVDKEASWPPEPTNFSIKCEAPLLANTNYIWEFLVQSNITSHSVLLFAYQNSSLKSYITLESVNIKYLGEIPPNESPVLYDEGFIADPYGPDLYPHTEFEFYVHYDDPEEYPPQMISVKLDDTLYPMRQDAGDKYIFEVTDLAAGTHIYSFYAVDKQGATVETSPCFLTIKEFNAGTFEFTGNVQINDSKDIYSANNEDGEIQSGEVVSIRPQIKYAVDASEIATYINVSLISYEPFVEEVYSPENYPDMLPSATSYPETGEYFKVEIDKTYSNEVFYLDGSVEWKGQDEENQNVYIENAVLLNVNPAAWINISPDEYNFGAVRPISENDVVLTLNIQNIGTDLLNISDIQTSHSDTEVNPTVLNIEPGQSSDVTVTIRVSSLYGSLIRDVYVIHDGRAKKDEDEHLVITGLVSNTPLSFEIPTINRPFEPDISGSRIVWHEDRDGDANSDILLYDVNLGKQLLMPSSQYKQGDSFISGNIVVWKDSRNWDGNGQWFYQAGIYGYDLSTQEEFTISSEPMYQYPVGVSGNLIAIKKPYQTLETNTDVARNLIVYEYLGDGQCVQKYTTGFVPIGGIGDRSSIGDCDFNNNILVFVIGDVSWGGTMSYGANSIYKIDFAAGETDKTPVNNHSAPGRIAAGLHNLVYSAEDPVSNDEHIYLWPGNTKVTPPTGDNYADSYLTFNGNIVVYDKDSSNNDMYYRGISPSSTEGLITNLLAKQDEGRMDGNGIVWEQKYEDGTYHMNFTYLEQSDMSISSSNISFSNDAPEEGTTIDVFTKIQNLTDYDVVDDITVKLFDGDPDSTGIQLGTDYVIPGGMTARSEVGCTFTSIPVSIEGEHEIYAQVLVDVFDVYANNKASKILVVKDAHTTELIITNVEISEYNGDGDGLIESDENIKIQWQVITADPLSISTTYCQVEDVNYIAEGNYYVIIGPFSEGDFTFTIYAEDSDISPESDTYQGNFSVCYPITIGDMTGDDKVDFFDYSFFSARWQRTDCTDSNWCEKADIDMSGDVGMSDLFILCEHWLEGVENTDHGLIAYYKLDEASGTVIDETGNYDGTNYGATTIVSGIDKTAYEFDSIDYVGTNLIPSIYATASIWIYPEVDVTGGFLGTGYTTDGGKDGWSWGYIGSGYNSVAIDFWKGNARIGDGIDTPNGSILLNQWSFITVVVSDTDISVYVNGEISTTGTLLSSPSVHDRGLMIGRNFQFGGGASTMNGIIDEVRIYNRVLSDDEIQYLYQNP